MKSGIKMLILCLKLLTSAFIMLVMLAPFIWMVSTSFKYNWDAISYPPKFFPQEFAGFSSYVRVFTDIPFFKFFTNSVLVATAVTLGALFSSSLAGYIFAKFEFKGRDALFIGILATMMIPFEVILIPLYLIVRGMGLVNSLWALIIPGLVSAYGIFLSRQFMTGIPSALIDAARIDGCGEFQIYVRIVMPLSKPVLSALGIFVFMANWDSFIWPLLVLDDLTKRTLPLGLALFRQQFGVMDWNVIMAGALISILPVMTVFFFAQKSFIEGIALSGLKG